MQPKKGSAAEAVEHRIGPEVKRLREAAGISLRTLAERAGFSPSFISQLENGQVSPSISSLGQIAGALNVTLADFFPRPATAEIVVVRADERPGFRSSWSKAQVDSLTPSAAGQAIDAIMVTLEPGGSSGTQLASAANEQLAVLFSGALSVTLQTQTVDLAPGDAVLIPARTPHRWQNKRRARAQVLLISPRIAR